ncbi:Rossmann-like and DUF2520 domain-containing protein [Flavobacterium sp. 140616W15]|uniref:Rossmann-like and DUF2520 domain-containing protein n=1 Tax=Flavobacterium sp. 140616W15 TaxID=2478552 RepID=UPI000F0BF01A|nr:Rossmann-like and DUF2520 domain-containing protein [Flavobacterium sp. 140616W15]AYN03636.1 DUF2520 domain-containing protein [Flavobacterium sp. 140616W15]
MIKITLIGSGNVSQHLINAFAKNSAIELIEVYSRTKKEIAPLLDSNKIVTDLALLKEADLYIIAVSDDAISIVSEQLPFKNKLVAHTSGTASLQAINTKNRSAVFYPLQTFTKNKEVDFKVIPLCLEAENNTDYLVLETVAKSISDAVYSINSEQRKALHVAAVFVNNFTNHLYQIGQEICEEHQVSFDTLKPLIAETANKINTLSPIEAQTGPAKRNDITTIESHLSYLSNENQKKIYTLLTKSIQNNGKKL